MLSVQSKRLAKNSIRQLNRQLSATTANPFQKVYPHNKDDNRQHVFQPVASKSILSPMTRKVPWLDAYKAREEKRAEYKRALAENPNAPPPDDGSFSFTSVKTRAVTEKTRADSFTFSVLPFKQDKWFLDAYVNSNGRLRIGQIFQDLDALAGVIAYKHCSPAEPVIVTASVDRIYMLKKIDNIEECDMTLSGAVTWSGRSSMEITIKAATHRETIDPEADLTEANIKDENVFLTANFTFVARDPDTKKSFPINKLVPQTPEEKVDFVRAEKFNSLKKIAAMQTGLQYAPPTAEESKIIHDIWIKNKDYHYNPEVKPQHIVNMSDTKIHSTAIMQPQYRNMHSYMIFGGYLLRQTFELAYACSAAFAEDVPRFVSLDSTTFRAPVPVGSVLYLSATVAYTEQTTRDLMNKNGEWEVVPGTLVQVRVDSSVRELDSGKSTDTGQFTYSYFAKSKPHQQKTSVLPQSYTEMMDYLEGRRKASATAQFYVERELGDISE